MTHAEIPRKHTLWFQMPGPLWLSHYPEREFYFFPKVIFFFYFFMNEILPLQLLFSQGLFHSVVAQFPFIAHTMSVLITIKTGNTLIKSFTILDKLRK